LLVFADVFKLGLLVGPEFNPFGFVVSIDSCVTHPVEQILAELLLVCDLVEVVVESPIFVGVAGVGLLVPAREVMEWILLGLDGDLLDVLVEEGAEWHFGLTFLARLGLQLLHSPGQGLCVDVDVL